MDCDRVFMILTRGPFPTGDSTDELVEQHLETCGDCWCLAEALRPALEVFQEAIPPIEGRDLPGYWGDARPAHSTSARSIGTAARLAPAKSLPLIARAASRQSLREEPSWFVNEMLPAIATATVLAAVLAGMVIWMRA